VDAARGDLSGKEVIVGPSAEASALHSKGSHGTPRSGGGLTLTLIEAAYLVEVGRLAVARGGSALSLSDLLALGGGGDDRFETRFLVYRDFRERGFVIREEQPSAGIDFSVRDRGGPAKAPSKYWVLAVSERSEFGAKEIFGYAARAEGLNKTPLTSVVDEEGDITHYEFATGVKESKSAHARGPSALGVLTGNHVLVSGPAAKQLHGEDELLGKLLRGLLRLSLIEAVYLAEEGRLAVRERDAQGREVSLEELRLHAGVRQADFGLRLAAYRTLKSRGLVPKTGFKYGTHFRVYDRAGGPGHARYLVHAVDSQFACPWAELSRAVRLSHGVKKRMLFAIVEPPNQVQFLRVQWVRP
jgi:tRNA-intron endonuclease, archaea type